MAEIEKKWYVLRAISGKEAKVKEYLEADIKNSDLGEYVSQVLIPTEKVYQVRNGKKIVKERSYLPGYVLVEAALVGEVSHHLRNTPNVIGFLGGSDKPVPLRQSEVNRILGTVDELQETGEDLNVPYIVGETVKVTFGPFSGFSGIIEEVNSEKKKLKVMVMQEALESDGDSALTLADVLQDSFCMEDTCETQDDIRRMRQLLDGLPARERQIILLRYGLSGQPPLTQLETAKLLDISRSYVSRLESHALELLRQRWDVPSTKTAQR